MVIVMARSFEGSTTQVERWYGTKFSIADFDGTVLENWQKAFAMCDMHSTSLHLPEKNDLIASDFGLKKADTAEEPRLVDDTSVCRLW